MNKFIIFLLLVFLIKNIWAQDDVRAKILMNKPNLHCPTGFVLDRIHYDQIEDLAENLDFSPHCIWKTIRNNATKYANGITCPFLFKLGQSIPTLTRTVIAL